MYPWNRILETSSSDLNLHYKTVDTAWKLKLWYMADECYINTKQNQKSNWHEQ